MHRNIGLLLFFQWMTVEESTEESHDRTVAVLGRMLMRREKNSMKMRRRTMSSLLILQALKLAIFQR